MKKTPSNLPGNQQDAIQRLKGLMNRVVIAPPKSETTEKIELTAALEKMPLEELQDLVDNLRVDLEKVVDFVREQEEELIVQTQTVEKLETKIKAASENDRFRLAVELANEQERKEMLEATLLGQRRNIRKREAIFNQHWQILRRRQGVFKADEYGEQIDLKPVLKPTEQVSSPTGEPFVSPTSQSKRSGKKLTLIALGILLLGGGILYGFKVTRPQPITTPSAPTDSQFPNSVSALGYLEPQGEIIKLSAPASGDGIRVDKLLVKQGERVKAGQIVAVLDNRDRLQAALEQAKSQVKVSQARLQQVEAGAKQGDIQAQDARFERIKAELEGQIISQKASIASLEAQLEGERSARQASVERIEAELTNAQKNCDRYKTLYQEGAVSDQDRDRICLQEATTRKTLQEAQANLNRTVSTLQNQISEAKANLSRTVATLERQIKEEGAMLGSVAEVRSVDVEITKAELESAKASVQRAQADLDLAYVRSPQNGQILKIYTRPGEVIGEKGIVDLGQTDQMYVTAEVYETDISRVRLGQPAIVKSDGVVGDLQGTVDEIGLQIGRKDVLGTDPVADTDARVVDVKIRLTQDDSYRVANLTNLQVNVVIDTSNAQANK